MRRLICIIIGHICQKVCCGSYDLWRNKKNINILGLKSKCLVWAMIMACSDICNHSYQQDTFFQPEAVNIFMPNHKKWRGYYVIPSKLLSVRPSICPSVHPSALPSFMSAP